MMKDDKKYSEVQGAQVGGRNEAWIRAEKLKCESDGAPI